MKRALVLFGLCWFAACGGGGGADGDPCQIGAAACGDSAPICDATLAVCRQCEAAFECADLDKGLNGCLAGQCVECTTNDQCGDRLCVNNQCVECVTDEDCPSGACDDNQCVECVDDEDCDSGVCVDQVCLECVSNDQCSQPTPECRVEANECVQCLDDGDCSSGAPYCDASSRDCVECLVDDHCDGGAVCDGGECD